MTQLLIRLFIRDPDDTRDPAVRTAYGNLASLVGMACNLLLCIGAAIWAGCGAARFALSRHLKMEPEEA